MTGSRVLYYSERMGRGITIRLESGDVCLLSVAQSGVIARSCRGFLAQLRVGFGGAVLYHEKDYFEASKNALRLDKAFAGVNLPVEIDHPVLNALARAVWQSRSAAEVSITLHTETVSSK